MTEQIRQYYVAETADGRFVAYATCAPYFCFVKDTEEGAIAIADRALALVERTDLEAVHVKSVSRTVTELTPTRVIRRETADFYA